MIAPLRKPLAANNWIVTRALGTVSETWLYRQITNQTRLTPHVVCWDYLNRETYPLPENVTLHLQPFDPSPDISRWRWAGRIRNAPLGNFYGTFGAERRALLRMVRQTNPSVMLCHFGHMALRLLPVAQASQVPLVAHFHGMDLSSSLKNKWYRWSLLKCLKQFAAVIVVGNHQQQWMLDHGVAPDKLHLIPCGVPTAQFDPRPRARHPAPRFLAVSRLVEGKGLDFTIRAFEIVKRSLPGAELVIAGDGPQRELLERLIVQLHLGGVHFRGAIPATEVVREMQSADVFVQHSIVDSQGWCEGFGVSIAEAMSMMLPVVASRSGGIVDQMIDGETGFLTPPGDVAAMADAMLRLGRNEVERSRMGIAGRQRMLSCFDTPRQIARLEDVLLSVARP